MFCFMPDFSRGQEGLVQAGVKVWLVVWLAALEFTLV